MKDRNRFDFFDSFEASNWRKEISVHKVNNEFFIHAAAGGSESAQVVFNHEEFSEFVKRCNKLL